MGTIKQEKMSNKKDDDAVYGSEEEIEPGLVNFGSEDIQKSEGPIATRSESADFFDIVPMRKPCKFCGVEIVTYIEKEVHPMFGITCIFVFMIFGFLGFIILPITYLLTQNVVHRCSRCLQKLGEKSCYGMPDDLSAPVWHFRLGKCSIVTSRLWAIIIGILSFAGSCFYVYMRPGFDLQSNPLFHHNIESKVIDATWEDFLNECGGTAILENQVHAKMLFNDHYENNIVSWKGYFTETKQRPQNALIFASDHHATILVKMSPSESDVFADIAISMSTMQSNRMLNNLGGLTKGDEIEFTG